MNNWRNKHSGWKRLSHLFLTLIIGLLSFDLYAQNAVVWPELLLTRLHQGFAKPVQITHAGDDRIFVVEQDGIIRLIKNGVVIGIPFLNVSDKVRKGGERGLLGLAFAPDYDTSRQFYVNYTNLSGATVIARYQASSDPDIADPASEEILLTQQQPFSNHNGGQLAFGSDGYLYIGMGDGGSGGDPQNNAQDPTTLLGKMLRIDVTSGTAPYGIPSNNPFIGDDGIRDEIWASGLRNPWRFSFDRLTGDLYIGDVGQSVIEEINFQSASSMGGENYGWRLFEGTRPFNIGQNDTTGLTVPVAEYDHTLGCSVTGGLVYRGGRYEKMEGIYFFGDFCSGRIWGLQNVNEAWHTKELVDTDFQITTFGDDRAGNLYVADFSTGDIYILTEVGADVALEMTATPNPAVIGREIRYTATITNDTRLIATDITLNSEVPVGASFASLAASQGSCETPAVGEAGEIVCALGTLDIGRTATLSVVVTVLSSADSTRTFSLQLQSPNDPDSTNNSVTIRTVTFEQGDISRSGDVEITDVVRVVRFLLLQDATPDAGSFDFIASDMDTNQTLDIRDLVRLVRVILGQPITKPAMTKG